MNQYTAKTIRYVASCMLWAAIVWAMAWCNVSKAEPIGASIQGYCLICVDRLSLEQTHIVTQRDGFYVIDDPQFTSRTAVLLDLKLAEYFYWKNDIHDMSASDRVRAVGWQWEGGMHITKYIDVFWFHHSQHSLDRDEGLYPLENRYGIRCNIIGGDK